MKSHRFLWGMLLSCLTFWASAQTATISGYITDATSKETLIGANIYDISSNAGTSSNNFGFYSIKVPIGEVHLRFNYVGYVVKDTTLFVEKSTRLNIELSEASTALSEVMIVGNRQSEVKGMDTGRIKMSMEDLNRTPAILGEADLIKYAQLLPGVARGQEGFSGLIVRGGGQDENLYLIDGNPMYNVNHLFGLFSAFNPDAIKTSTLYKGSFPARFGGRLSSVLDVRMKDGDMEKFSGTASIGLVSSRLNLEGPIKKGKTSYNISLRRTYLDLLMKAAYHFSNKSAKESASNYYSQEMPGYYFYDANFKLNHKFDDRNRVFLSLYMGNDVLDFQSKDYQTTEGGYSHFLTAETSSLAKWGSKLASLGWTHVFSSNLFANTNLYYGEYAASIAANDHNYQLSKSGQSELTLGFEYDITSGIRDFGVRSDFDWTPSNKHYVRFGANLIRHNFRPNIETRNLSGVDIKKEDKGLAKSTKGEPISANELSLYAEDEIQWSDRFSTNIGLHASVINVEGKTYYSAQPRLSARYEILPNLSAKASYAEMNQYVHLLQTTVISLPTDMWVPVTKKVRPMHSRQTALGLYWDNGAYEVSMEGYYKSLNNLIAYKDGATAFLSEIDWQERVAAGTGRAYGFEWLLRKSQGKFTGWIAYTLSWTDRLFKNGEVNRGRRFPDKYDNRHKLNIVGMYRLGKNVELSAAWTYSSGNRMTIQQEQYIDIDHHVNSFIDQRNNYALPAYHRLDLGLNIYRPKKNGNMGIWNISVYNAYMQHNSFMVSLDEMPAGPRSRAVIRSVSVFPIIPSVSYTYKF
ncbi:TonB-dependent receptor [Porphyromonas sp.]|uniref:TonB-dependent receptor n=1 Tax=Porphyromonas sp. TaxID=1924944 RepID=UPI0026DC5DF9|nr:TonB-dependent receptor [Porphyromonas sp.]MDO4770951.1 TonB-dependent receptor [Porphyromonas sp.]